LIDDKPVQCECFEEHGESRGNGFDELVSGSRLRDFPLVLPAFAISGRILGVKRKQSSLGDQQIRQAKQREELCGVLGLPAVARLPQRKNVLDEVEEVLDLQV